MARYKVTPRLAHLALALLSGFSFPTICNAADRALFTINGEQQKVFAYFKCPSSFALETYPDLQSPFSCVILERVNWKGEASGLIKVDWGSRMYGDTGGYKDSAYFVVRPNGQAERINGLGDVILSLRSRPTSRYRVFATSTGIDGFWRNNLGSENVFDSELFLQNGIPCIRSDVRPPFKGSLLECQGKPTTGSIGYLPGALPLTQAIELARASLEREVGQKALNSRPFPSTSPNSHVTYQDRGAGSYWAMTYRGYEQGSGNEPELLIRVFVDKQVEIVRYPDTQRWTVENVQ